MAIGPIAEAQGKQVDFLKSISLEIGGFFGRVMCIGLEQRGVGWAKENKT